MYPKEAHGCLHSRRAILDRQLELACATSGSQINSVVR
jgi:hypothetical protein